MKVTWRKIGSDMKGEGELGWEIDKGKKLYIIGDKGIFTTPAQDVLFDSKQNLCLVYTKNSIYEVCFE